MCIRDRAYAFDYDGMSRLKGADYGNTSMLINTDKYDVKGISYDNNGNILSLKRNADGSVIDDLIYSYQGNQLKAVEDVAVVLEADSRILKDFVNGVSEVEEYLYDANGNIIKDKNKGISNIQYNILNLPEKITFADGKEIKYVYTASGEKLQNIVNGKTLTYCGGFVYEGTDLKYILNSEGRYVVNGGSGAYEYNLTDHLGNVRAVVDGASGDVKQKSNYYPFGMTFGIFSNSDNKYLYNGKELQEGTNWLDYGARMYQPELGRWFNVDPLAEKYLSESLYGFSGNNPIVNMDFNGMDYWSTSDPSQIAAFMDSFRTSGSIDYSGLNDWRHLSDEDFLKGLQGNCTFNDESNMLLTSLNFIINNEVVCCGVSIPMLSRGNFKSFEEYRFQACLESEAPIIDASSITPRMGYAPIPSFSKLNPKTLLKSVKLIKKMIKKGCKPKQIKLLHEQGVDIYGRPIRGRQTHIHLKDGRAFNFDGTWRHGEGDIPNKVVEWLIKITQ